MKVLNKILAFLFFLIVISGLSAYSQDLPVACGDGLVRYGVYGYNGTSTFEWTITGGEIVNNYNDSVDIRWNNVGGEHYITVIETTNSGCIGNPFIDTVLVSIPFVDLGLDAEICFGESYEFDAQESDITAYLWQDGSNGETLIANQSGQYWVRTTDTYGCVASDTATLVVRDLLAIDLGNDTTYCGEFGLELDAYHDRASFYDWSDGSTGSMLTAYSQTQDQEIWVKVTDDLGCEGSDTIIVRACGDIEVPTAFTPNGDGHNETWQIDALIIYPECTVDVYNRWGDRVFHSKGYGSDQYWDGTNDGGKELPMDAYYFVINLNNGEEPIVGHITIIR